MPYHLIDFARLGKIANFFAQSCPGLGGFGPEKIFKGAGEPGYVTRYSCSTYRRYALLSPVGLIAPAISTEVPRYPSIGCPSGLGSSWKLLLVVLPNASQWTMQSFGKTVCFATVNLRCTQRSSWRYRVRGACSANRRADSVLIPIRLCRPWTAELQHCEPVRSLLLPAVPDLSELYRKVLPAFSPSTCKGLRTPWRR